jgi:DNA-binding LacI/PurR family transcriptional regulator
MVGRAVALGHRRFAYVGNVERAESMRDRWTGFVDGLADHGGELALHVPVSHRPGDETLDRIAEAGATVAFFLERADAIELAAAAGRRGLAVPGDLSLVVTGSHERALRPADIAFTSFGIPREEMGRQATAMLAGMLEGRAAPGQVLVPCEFFAGATLGAPVARRSPAPHFPDKKETVT